MVEGSCGICGQRSRVMPDAIPAVAVLAGLGFGIPSRRLGHAHAPFRRLDIESTLALSRLLLFAIAL